METQVEVQKLAEQFLKKICVEGIVDVIVDETGAYRVHIDSPETGLLIGRHGQTLESLQIILGIAASKVLNSWVRVYVNVGDYREKREEALHYMAQRAADQAVSSGKPVDLTSLTPSERRVVHLALSGDERIKTESSGEGQGRILHVIPQTEG